MEFGQKPTAEKSYKKAKIAGGIITLVALAGIFGGHGQPAATETAPQTSVTQQTNTPNEPTKTSPAATTQEFTPAPAPTTSTPVSSTPAPAAAPAPAPAPTPAPKTCSSGYYVNVDGNCIQSPTAAPSAPAGATAECRDGTYSFSQNHSGTCSHHGGVARWL